MKLLLIGHSLKARRPDIPKIQQENFDRVEWFNSSCGLEWRPGSRQTIGRASSNQNTRRLTSNLTILSLIKFFLFGRSQSVHHSNTPAVGYGSFQSVDIMFRRCHCSSKKPSLHHHIYTMIMLEVCCSCSSVSLKSTLKILLLLLSILFFWLTMDTSRMMELDAWIRHINKKGMIPMHVTNMHH